MNNQVYLVTIKWIKKYCKNHKWHIYLFPKPYVFYVTGKLADDIKVGSIVHSEIETTHHQQCVVVHYEKQPIVPDQSHKLLTGEVADHHVWDLKKNCRKLINKEG